MASWIASLLSLVWPPSDLSISRKIVQSLPLPPSTKHFIFALRDPEHPTSVVYILATVILSERSASDARDLVKSINPRAVIAQVGSDALEAIQVEHQKSLNPNALETLPTSPVHVIQKSFRDGNNRFKYLKMAEAEVVRAIFGTTFAGHVTAAKEAAAESNSSFYYLESPPALEGHGSVNASSAKDIPGSLHSPLSFQSACKTRLTSLASSQPPSLASHIVSSLQDSLSMALSSSRIVDQRKEDYNAGEVGYDCPEFAQSFYPLLTDLHSVYQGLPGMTLALERTRKLLRDVDKGKGVDRSELALSQCFRLAVEGLRVALNETAVSPLRSDTSMPSKVHFDDLPYEEKCYVLLAQALKQQAQQSQTVVAILDAASIAGIRKHWMTPVPDHVVDLAKDCLVSEDDEVEEIDSEGLHRKAKLLDKPIVVVGAGAAAAFGLASVSHLAPVSTAMKILTFKVPTIIKLGLLQTKKGAVVAMAKLVTPVTKLLVPAAKGFRPSNFIWGSKGFLLKVAGSTGKLRAAAHSVIATAEKASLSAIRTAFYHVMRNRHRKSAGGRPWLSFGMSIAACGGLLTFGDGIENVIETLPEAPSIAQLGRGVNSLSDASETLKQAENAEYWENMYKRLYGMLNRKH